jgi:hypothetical protein
VISNNTVTDAQLQSESQAALQEPYTPECDGQNMGPRDTCIRFGKGQKSQTYREMVDEHEADLSVEAFASSHKHWRVFGYVVAIAGALLTLLTVYLLVLVVRSRAGRRSLAKANGWQYQHLDPTLLERIANPELKFKKPEAADVISGNRNGFAFLMFDFRDADKTDTKETAFLLALPEPLPRIVVSATNGYRLDNTSAGEAGPLWTPQVAQYVVDNKLGPLQIDGTWLVFRYPGVVSPKKSVIVKEVDHLATLAAMLLNAKRGGGPSIPQQPQPFPQPAQSFPGAAQPFPPAPSGPPPFPPAPQP